MWTVFWNFKNYLLKYDKNYWISHKFLNFKGFTRDQNYFQQILMVSAVEDFRVSPMQEFFFNKF